MAYPKPPFISAFAAGELKLHLDYMQNALGDKSYILGDELQGPDFGLSYIVQLANRLDVLSGYDNLKNYLDRNIALPAFQRAKEKAAVISFNIEGIHPYDIGSIVDKLGIAVRTGHHCARPVHVDGFGLRCRAAQPDR